MFILKLIGVLIIIAIIAFSAILVMNISKLEKEIAEETKQEPDEEPHHYQFEDES
nr:hypothetical protein [Desulfobacteraceae bacterium]